MTRRVPNDSREVRRAARATIAALAEYNIESCVFGSAACQIYGMSDRVPNDVDIVLLTDDEDIEYIKSLVVDHDERFYLVPSRNPRATYKKLYFKLRRGRACKVDILPPGRATNLNIPVIPSSELEYVNPYDDIPVMPIVPLLLMKLQGWTDNRDASEPYKRAKEPQDVKDLFALLRIAVKGYKAHISDVDDWMPSFYVEEAEWRVEEFVEEHPRSKMNWKKIGFEV
ncbi:hypothetical protein PM082_006557 [Marasmius tenuissimus]|nr:hypothetical protein PM082_006557 [Marasmius tenuissimus]